MTLELDDLDLFTPSSETVVETPRKHRHQWVTGPFVLDPYCARCGAKQDAARSRRGKTSRNRGNAFEREVAAKLGGRRVGQYGTAVDVEVPGYLKVQTKNGGAYPALLDRWLRAVPVQAGELRAVVVGDAPGPGTKRRSLIVMDFDEFCAYYGKG